MFDPTDSALAGPTLIHMPKLAYTGGRYPWVLRTPLVYRTAVPGALSRPYIEVPTGYRTDFASVPRLPLIYWRTGGRATIPAIIHDWLYDCATQCISRRTADAIFLEAMRLMGDPPWPTTRALMWLGVRVGGWRGWSRDSRGKCRP